MADHTSSLVEDHIRDVSPDGYETTLTDDSRLRQLDNQSVSGVLEDIVSDYNDYELSELEVIDYEVRRIMSAFLTPERTIELPGTALEYTNGNIHSFAAAYKESDDTPTGTIMDLRRAQSDDLVFTPLTPAAVNNIVGADPGDPNYVENFITDDVAAGEEVVVLGEDGYDSDTEAPLDLSDNERVYFTGDFIDLSAGDSIFTRFEWVSVDNKTEDYGPIDQTLDKRLSGAHLGIGSGAYVKRDAELHARAYDDGDAELWPVAFYMAPGHQAPSL